MGTTGHESEAVNIQGLKASLQKFKTDKVDVKADLGQDGLVPSNQLPSYVDDVIEYDKKADFPVTGEAGKIYVNKANNTTWRWSGSTYTQIKGDLVIGTTQGSAADGKVVDDHVNNTSNPHQVTASQVGLGNVGNFKAVSTGATQGLDTTEQSNARANIGLGSAATKDVPSSGNASSSQVVMGDDSRLSDSRAANGGNADTIDSYHIAVVSSMPASPDANTIYIVK